MDESSVHFERVSVACQLIDAFVQSSMCAGGLIMADEVDHGGRLDDVCKSKEVGRREV